MHIPRIPSSMPAETNKNANSADTRPTGNMTLIDVN